MKKLLLLVLCLSGCVGSKTFQPTPAYMGVLPTYRSLVAYRIRIPRSGVSPSVADQRAKAWLISTSRVLRFQEQNPILKKTDIVFIGHLQAHPVPDTSRDNKPFPPVRLWVTLDNQGDSTRVWVTNFEVAGKRDWESFEKQLFSSKSAELTKQWLVNIDGTVTAMLDLFRDLLSKP